MRTYAQFGYVIFLTADRYLLTVSDDKFFSEVLNPETILSYHIQKVKPP